MLLLSEENIVWFYDTSDHTHTWFWKWENTSKITSLPSPRPARNSGPHGRPAATPHAYGDGGDGSGSWQKEKRQGGGNGDKRAY